MAWVTPRLWALGETATAAKMNEISSSLNALGGSAWQSYVPVWDATVTPPTMGASTITGFYRENGGSVECEILLTIGAGVAAGSGFYTITLPVATSAVANQVVRGNGMMLDVSGAVATNRYSLGIYRASSGGGLTVGMSGYGARWTDTSPATPAVGDVISLALEYRK